MGEERGRHFRDLRSVARNVSWGMGFPPSRPARRDLSVAVEKVFRMTLRLSTTCSPGLKVETCFCLCRARACVHDACVVVCVWCGAPDGMWCAARCALRVARCEGRVAATFGARTAIVVIRKGFSYFSLLISTRKKQHVGPRPYGGNYLSDIGSFLVVFCSKLGVVSIGPRECCVAVSRGPGMRMRDAGSRGGGGSPGLEVGRAL